MGSLIQQDLFKKADHRMVILTSFHPSLEEKQKFHRAQKFQRLRLAECRRPTFTTPQSTRKNVDQDMLWIILEAKEGIFMAK